MANNVSPSGSVKGYSFKVWLARNLETFKLLGASLGGLVTYYSASLPPHLSAVAGVAATVAAKLLLDFVHFYLKDVQLE